MLARKLALLAAVGCLAAPARAEIKLHPLLSDHAVLQRGKAVPVRGTAAPGAMVAVGLSGPGGYTFATKQPVAAGPDGAFSVALPADLKTGGPYTLTVTAGTDKVELKDVLVGDVWVCSGQSNMEWKVAAMNKTDDGQVSDLGTKAAAASANPNLRLFTVRKTPSAKPLDTVPVDPKAGDGLWLEAKPETVINFSAVGYFFGRDVQKAENIPIGLISSNWGGTSCQSWCSREALEGVPELKYYPEQFDQTAKTYDPEKAKAAFEKAKADFPAVQAKWKEAAAKAKADGKPVPPAPRAPQLQGPPGTGPTTTTLYNGMIAPLLQFPIKGAIWYQGESNAGKAAEYRTLMPTMISDWRKRWNDELPFFIVQLAPFRGGASGVDYAELRDAQVHTTKVLPKVGIAVITDSGHETNIHPQAKEPVGARLALAARAIAYGEKVEYSGPAFKALKVEGDKAVVSFDHVGGGLVAKGGELTGFTVAGADNVYHPAKAEIAGDTVVVTSDKVSQPKAVRFGWVNFAKPTLNFFNKAGLPAVPFRTDDLPLTTATPPAPPKK